MRSVMIALALVALVAAPVFGKGGSGPGSSAGGGNNGNGNGATNGNGQGGGNGGNGGHGDDGGHGSEGGNHGGGGNPGGGSPAPSAAPAAAPAASAPSAAPAASAPAAAEAPAASGASVGGGEFRTQTVNGHPTIYKRKGTYLLTPAQEYTWDVFQECRVPGANIARLEVNGGFRFDVTSIRDASAVILCMSEYGFVFDAAVQP